MTNRLAGIINQTGRNAKLSVQLVDKVVEFFLIQESDDSIVASAVPVYQEFKVNDNDMRKCLNVKLYGITVYQPWGTFKALTIDELVQLGSQQFNKITKIVLNTKPATVNVDIVNNYLNQISAADILCVVRSTASNTELDW